jgi:hypothetical protein
VICVTTAAGYTTDPTPWSAGWWNGLGTHSSLPSRFLRPLCHTPCPSTECDTSSFFFSSFLGLRDGVTALRRSERASGVDMQHASRPGRGSGRIASSSFCKTCSFSDPCNWISQGTASWNGGDGCRTTGVDKIWFCTHGKASLKGGRFAHLVVLQHAQCHLKQSQYFAKKRGKRGKTQSNRHQHPRGACPRLHIRGDQRPRSSPLSKEFCPVAALACFFLPSVRTPFPLPPALTRTTHSGISSRGPYRAPSAAGVGETCCLHCVVSVAT